LVGLVLPANEPNANHNRNCSCRKHPLCDPLRPRSSRLCACHVVELLSLLARARGLGLRAGIEEGLYQIGNLWRTGLTFLQPELARLKGLSTHKQRLRPIARPPACRRLAEPGMLANPFNILTEGLGQLRQRPRKPWPGIEPDELQPAELCRDIGIRHRLEDYRQQTLRQLDCLVDLPAAAFRFHGLRGNHEYDRIGFLDEAAQPRFPILARGNVVAIEKRRKPGKFHTRDQLVGERPRVLARVGDEDL
jgi:hypothetical protein